MSSTTGRQPKPTILITGLNGYIAGRTAELALKSGYRVRGTVRTNEAGVQVKEALCCLGYHADDIEVIQITDLCQYGPLEVAAKGIAVFTIQQTQVLTNIIKDAVRFSILPHHSDT
jgi:nucleoside-diphosphate-sugar epimerase